MKVQRILETALYVNDLHAAAAFYSDILGLQFFAAEYPRHVFFKCGDGMLLLFNPDATQTETNLPPHGARGSQHMAFAVPSADIEQWKQHLERNGIAIAKDMLWPNGTRSLYFNDPAGNSIELTSPALWNLE